MAKGREGVSVANKTTEEETPPAVNRLRDSSGERSWGPPGAELGQSTVQWILRLAGRNAAAAIGSQENYNA
jgi:hypothetical protein